MASMPAAGLQASSRCGVFVQGAACLACLLTGEAEAVAVTEPPATEALVSC